VRIGYVIGRLGRGGAEIQLTRLAAGIAARSHDVEVFAYGGSSPLDDELETKGVRVRTVLANGRIAKIRAARSWLRGFRPAVVHGVMKRASSVVLLSRVGVRGVRVVATDMSTATFKPNSVPLRASLLLFGTADRVVTQTDVNKASLTSLAPWLGSKTMVIRNGVDTERFAPAPRTAPSDAPFRFCVVGTVYAAKNPTAVVRAVDELLRRGSRSFRVDWFGRLSLDPEAAERREYNPAVRLSEELGLGEHICFHGQTAAVEEVLRESDALLHAAVQEGFPNAVAEAMACGLPLVVSRVSDLPAVVREARNGFVFDESDPKAIADAMERMMALEETERQRMGDRSRELAIRWFGIERFVDDFEALYRDLAGACS
jgi:glycosyltransferase involved in cell wall biosynthesis